MAGCCIAHRGPSREPRPKVSQLEIELAREDRKARRLKGDGPPRETCAERHARRRARAAVIEASQRQHAANEQLKADAKARENERDRLRTGTPLLA